MYTSCIYGQEDCTTMRIVLLLWGDEQLIYVWHHQRKNIVSSHWHHQCRDIIYFQWHHWHKDNFSPQLLAPYFSGRQYSTACHKHFHHIATVHATIIILPLAEAYCMNYFKPYSVLGSFYFQKFTGMLASDHTVSLSDGWWKKIGREDNTSNIAFLAAY